MSPIPPERDPLQEAFAALEPRPDRTARLEERVVADLAADRRSLAAEWLDLFRVGPVLQAGYAVTAAAGLAILTPVGSLLFFALLM